MSNYTRTVNDPFSLEIEGGQFRDDLLHFAAAGTVSKGTILARDSVSLKLVPFVKGGASNQNGIPKAVLTYDVTASGAGDIPVRALEKGVVRKQRLIIAADGNDSNIDGAVIDGLRAYGITPIDTQQLAQLDN